MKKKLVPERITILFGNWVWAFYLFPWDRDLVKSKTVFKCCGPRCWVSVFPLGPPTAFIRQSDPKGKLKPTLWGDQSGKTWELSAVFQDGLACVFLPFFFAWISAKSMNLSSFTCLSSILHLMKCCRERSKTLSVNDEVVLLWNLVTSVASFVLLICFWHIFTIVFLKKVHICRPFEPCKLKLDRERYYPWKRGGTRNMHCQQATIKRNKLVIRVIHNSLQI